jgi:hypothetical protein
MDLEISSVMVSCVFRIDYRSELRQRASYSLKYRRDLWKLQKCLPAILGYSGFPESIWVRFGEKSVYRSDFIFEPAPATSFISDICMYIFVSDIWLDIRVSRI